MFVAFSALPRRQVIHLIISLACLPIISVKTMRPAHNPSRQSDVNLPPALPPSLRLTEAIRTIVTTPHLDHKVVLTSTRRRRWPLMMDMLCDVEVAVVIEVLCAAAPKFCADCAAHLGWVWGARNRRREGGFYKNKRGCSCSVWCWKGVVLPLF